MLCIESNCCLFPSPRILAQTLAQCTSRLALSTRAWISQSFCFFLLTISFTRFSKFCCSIWGKATIWLFTIFITACLGMPKCVPLPSASFCFLSDPRLEAVVDGGLCHFVDQLLHEGRAQPMQQLPQLIRRLTGQDICWDLSQSEIKH